MRYIRMIKKNKALITISLGILTFFFGLVLDLIINRNIPVILWFGFLITGIGFILGKFYPDDFERDNKTLLSSRATFFLKKTSPILLVSFSILFVLTSIFIVIYDRSAAILLVFSMILTTFSYLITRSIKKTEKVLFNSDTIFLPDRKEMILISNIKSLKNSIVGCRIVLKDSREIYYINHISEEMLSTSLSKSKTTKLFQEKINNWG